MDLFSPGRSSAVFSLTLRLSSSCCVLIAHLCCRWPSASTGFSSYFELHFPCVNSLYTGIQELMAKLLSWGL